MLSSKNGSLKPGAQPCSHMMDPSRKINFPSERRGSVDPFMHRALSPRLPGVRTLSHTQFPPHLSACSQRGRRKPRDSQVRGGGGPRRICCYSTSENAAPIQRYQIFA